MSDGITLKIRDWDKNQNRLQAKHGPDEFPMLYNLSGRFFYRMLPCPINVADPEFVYIPMNGENRLETIGVIGQWSMAWEAAQFRTDICTRDIPERFAWLNNIEDRNIYLVPQFKQNSYSVYLPLYHLLPAKVLERFGLPLVERGNWPASAFLGDEVESMPKDFDKRFARAFASHIWPHLNSQSGLRYFDDTDPIKILAHNLNFWLPYIYKVAEERLGRFPRHDFENEEDRRIRDDAQAKQPPGIVDIRPPLTGGAIWYGEEDAFEATRELVEKADVNGRLRGIIDAVRSNRVEEDFSDCWSYAREDFERKLYSKRSKIKVSFVELDDTIPVHSHESEVHDKLIWENFIALLNPKERQIVICIRNGKTALGEIAKEMGYANHSPVSKALANIRKKAAKLLL